MLRTTLVVAVPLTALIALTPAEASSRAYPQAGPSSHSTGSSSGISLSPFTRYFHSNWHQQHNHNQPRPHHQARPVPTSTATSVPTSTAIATATPSPTETPTATPAPAETPAPTPTPISTATPVPQSSEGTGGDARAAIAAASARWHVSYGWLLRVASCESGLNPYAQNPSGASGLFQFMPGTYYAYAARIGETGSIWNAYSNANVAGYMFSIGQSYQWTCR